MIFGPSVRATAQHEVSSSLRAEVGDDSDEDDDDDDDDPEGADAEASLAALLQPGRAAKPPRPPRAPARQDTEDDPWAQLDTIGDVVFGEAAPSIGTALRERPAYGSSGQPSWASPPPRFAQHPLSELGTVGDAVHGVPVQQLCTQGSSS